jgi:cytoskeletal protein RodZ
MNRNQKIALGCGGAGCLGLIVVVIAGLVIYFLAYSSPSRNRNRNFNVSTNRNSNTNDNSDLPSNANDNSSNSSDSSSASASSLSEDDKHKLYQAAGMTGDAATVRDVSIKIGLIGDDNMPRENYQSFIYDHIDWAQRNTDFIQSINTAEKARAYLDANLPD